MTKADLNELVTYHQLGGLINTVNWSKSKARSNIFDNGLWALMSIVLMIIFYSISPAPLPLWVFGILGLCFLSFGFFARNIWRNRLKLGANARAISLFEHGFIDERSTKLQVFRYQDVVEIWQTQVEVRGAGYFSNYSIKQKDGSSCLLNEQLDEIDSLGSFLQQACLPYQFPQLLAALQAGETVSFDPTASLLNQAPELALTKEGLLYKKKLYAWQELGLVEFQRGYLYFNGGTFTHSIPIPDINNLHVFVPLLQHMRDTATNQT